MKSVITILSLAFLLTACSKGQGTFGSMSTGIGAVKNCGQFKFSDPACNPALSAGGSGN